MTGSVLVDTNVLIDVLQGDPPHATWSRDQLRPLIQSGQATINPLIFAELAALYGSPDAPARAVPETIYRREALPWAAGYAAGQAFRAYRSRGGVRRSPLPEFYIGAHAQVAGMQLLTRDTTRYRTYFPEVNLITPDE